MEDFVKQLPLMEARVFRLLNESISPPEITMMLGITRNNLNQIVWRIRKKALVQGDPQVFEIVGVPKTRATRFIDTPEAFEAGVIRPVPPTR